jgi:N-acetyl-alpha-D-muramate 1-phosphate uridylyltransferase
VSLPIAVLAGGLATRLRPLTERIPKILIDVAGRPFGEHQIELFKRQGLSHVVFSVAYLGEQVRDAFGDGSRWGMTFSYVFDGPRPMGTGGALQLALPELTRDGSAFFVIYGDSYLTCEFSAVEHTFRANGKPALMTVLKNDDRWDRSNVQFERGRIVRYDKRGAAGAAAMHHIDYGLGVLTAPVFEPWQNSSAPFDLADVYRRLIDRGELAGHEVHERFYEIGSPEGLADTRRFLEAQTS